MKGDRRDNKPSGRELPRLSRGDLVKAVHLDQVYQFVNRARQNTLVAGRQETRRVRVKITAKNATTKVCSGTLLYNSIKSGATWTETSPSHVLSNIVDSDDSVEINSEAWVHYYPQDGQWHVESGAASSGTVDSGVDSDFVCCKCTNSTLYFAAANSDVTVAKVTSPKSFVTNSTIEHQITITCTASGDSATYTLEPLDCESIHCKTLDLTGVAIGSCTDVGIIYYGNSSTCIPSGVVICPTNPPPHFSTGGSTTLSIGDGDGSLPLDSVSSETVSPSSPSSFVRPEKEESAFYSEFGFQVGTNGAAYAAEYSLILNGLSFGIGIYKGVSAFADGIYLITPTTFTLVSGFDTNRHTVRMFDTDGNPVQDGNPNFAQIDIYFDGALVEQSAVSFSVCGRIISELKVTLWGDYRRNFAVEAMDASTLEVFDLNGGFI